MADTIVYQNGVYMADRIMYQNLMYEDFNVYLTRNEDGQNFINVAGQTKYFHVVKNEGFFGKIMYFVLNYFFYKSWKEITLTEESRTFKILVLNKGHQFDTLIASIYESCHEKEYRSNEQNVSNDDRAADPNKEIKKVRFAENVDVRIIPDVGEIDEELEPEEIGSDDDTFDPRDDFGDINVGPDERSDT